LELQNKELSAKQMQRNIFVAGSILLFFTAFFIYRNFQNQRKINQLLKTSAEKEKIELQLQSLRSQLNPHFMFNSLNAIQELIVTEKNELSQSYLERFAQLLRNLLENANQPFISLRQELQFLELYLSLESLRIPDLDYKISVDPKLDLDNSIIPNMMLQPYVENALWHGLQHKMGHKALQLTVYKRDEALHYEIRDNGVGREKAGAFKSLYRKGHNSKGMELLSKRFSLLSQEYGRKIQVEIKDLFENKEAKGTAVTISVPTAMMETSKMSYA
jgi:LytS/YehU family sensor histidine kinase